MFDKDYLIIHKSILPDFYELVINARDLVENEGYSTSAACKEVDISRSTYYKYKDYIYKPSREFGRKAILSFKVADKKGLLGTILNVIYETKGSVIAINQGIAIKDIAYITLTLDLAESKESIDDLIFKLKNLKHVKKVNLLAID